jgi:hypothetical protein
MLTNQQKGNNNMITYIYNKDSFDNSIEVNNYPWGFKKTSKRYWLETNNKGTRLVSSTKNPKNGEWCKPKVSTYIQVGVLTSNDKEIVEFIKTVDVQQLPKLSQKAICFLKAKNYAWKDVKVEFVCNPTPEQSQKLKENEEKAKKYLSIVGNRAYKTCLVKNNLN